MKSLEISSNLSSVRPIAIERLSRNSRKKLDSSSSIFTPSEANEYDEKLKAHAGMHSQLWNEQANRVDLLAPIDLNENENFASLLQNNS